MTLILSGTDGLSDVDGSAATPAIRGTDANTGIFFPAADTIAFSEGGVESMRIDSSGNVGIGTTTMTQKLNVEGSIGTRNGGHLISTGSNTNAGGLYLDSSGSKSISLRADPDNDASGTYIGFNTDGTERMRIDSAGNMGLGVTPSALASGYKGFEINVVGNALTSSGSILNLSTNAIRGATFTYGVTSPASLYQQSSGTHNWYTAPSGTAGNTISFTQAMTLQTGTYGGQQLLLNTTAVGNAGTSAILTGSRLSVGAVAYSANAFGCLRIQDTNTGTSFKSEWGIVSDGAGQPFTTISFQTGIYFVTGDSGASAKIAFDSSGNASKLSGAGSWLALSDSRIKTNVQTVTNGLSRILQLNPVTFNYKSPEAHNGKVHDKGFIADEFMVVYPDSVTETEFVPDEDKQYIEEGFKAKAMGFNAEFYADLVSSIQELKAIVDAQAVEIAALKGTP